MSETELALRALGFSPADCHRAVTLAVEVEAIFKKRGTYDAIALAQERKIGLPLADLVFRILQYQGKIEVVP